MHFLKSRKESLVLSDTGIDAVSELITDALTEARIEHKDILRLRLAAEDVMLIWKEKLPENTVCSFKRSEWLRHTTVTISVPGPKLDPAEINKDDEEMQLYSMLHSYDGYLPVYDYANGENRLILSPSKSVKSGSNITMLLTIAAAVLAGYLCRFLPVNIGEAVNQVVGEFVSTFMGILKALAGPLIFFSICAGMINIGDMSVLSRIGKTVLFRYLSRVFIMVAVTAACFSWIFVGAGTEASSSSNAFIQILTMLLDIIPDNVVAPFISGNCLQIMFMAICLGSCVLALNEKVALLRNVILQADRIMHTLMKAAGKLIQIMIFLNILTLMYSQKLSGFGGLLKGCGILFGLMLAYPVIYSFIAARRLKVPYLLFAQKIIPGYLVALTTASSAAALPTVMENGEKCLGIQRRLVSFAVPLGQMFFRLGLAVKLLISALFLAEAYGISVTLPWVITMAVCGALLSIAAPPIPKGSTAVFALLLAQAGIPMDAVAIMLAIDVIGDFLSTGCNIGCLQSELALTANKLGMIDKDVLRRKSPLK